MKHHTATFVFLIATALCLSACTNPDTPPSTIANPEANTGTNPDPNSTAKCDHKPTKLASGTDPEILQRLQGEWAPTPLSCDDELPLCKGGVADDGESEGQDNNEKQIDPPKSRIVFNQTYADLKVSSPTCETISRFKIEVINGKLIWRRARLLKTTCPEQQPHVFYGDLKFEIELTDRYLKLKPLTRDSIPCGVLVRSSM